MHCLYVLPSTVLHGWLLAKTSWRGLNENEPIQWQVIEDQKHVEVASEQSMRLKNWHVEHTVVEAGITASLVK